MTEPLIPWGRKDDPIVGRPQDSGFTLVELLVVLAVIAILVSLLLPALSRAKSSSQRIVCSNHLRQVALTALMYADDNQGRFPDRTSDNRWDQKLDLGNSLPSDILNCPNDRTIPTDGLEKNSRPTLGKPSKSGRGQQKTSSQIRVGSYIMNGFTDVVGYGQSTQLEKPSSYGMLLSAVSSPSKTLLFGEKSSNSSAFYADVLPLTSDYLEHIEERRHNTSSKSSFSGTEWSALSNYSFVDGHVEPIHFGKATCPENMWCVSDEWRLNAALCRPRY